MKFCEKIVLKDVQEFQNLTAEEKETELTLFGHKFIARWITGLLMYTTILLKVAIALCIIVMIVCITIKGIVASIVFHSILPILISILMFYFVILYKVKRKNQTIKEIEKRLIEKIENLWLLNYKVISFKDWRTIKKRNKVLYEKARSEASYRKCYYTSYALANTLENPEIKILWICIDVSNNRCGHSVIVKKDKIYDSNFRKTYNREEYLKAMKAEIFKEYSIEEYMNKSNLKKEQFDFLDWEEFGKWCEEKNAVRTN